MPSDAAYQAFWGPSFHSIGSYREYAIAIEGEAGDSLTQTASIDQSGLVRKERNVHCDVPVAPENEHILPPFGSPDSFWMTPR